MVKEYVEIKTDKQLFEEKFDTVDCPTYTAGVYKLTADGCTKRHKLPRDKQYLGYKECIDRNFRYNNIAEYEERVIVRKAATLMSQGHRISKCDGADGSDGLKAFVERITNDNL
jgi:hypothetical protein